MTYELVDELELDLEPDRVEAIRCLLAEAFPDSPFATRHYTKQIANRRILATENDTLIGHLALEYRVIGTTTGPTNVLGVVDLCVGTGRRGRGIGSAMLAEVETLARAREVDFLVLFAHDPRLYVANGYRHASNPLRWVKMHEHQVIGIGEEPVDELMVKPVGKRRWPDGLVDLLGHIF